jgi:hypothetical protein
MSNSKSFCYVMVGCAAFVYALSNLYYLWYLKQCFDLIDSLMLKLASLI